MMISEQQLGNGLAQYIKSHIVPSVPDVWSRRVMSGIADLIILKPDTVHKVTERYPIFEMLEDEDEMYDLDVMERVVKKNMQEYGDLTLDIMGGEYTFSPSDIDRLVAILHQM